MCGRSTCEGRTEQKDGRENRKGELDLKKNKGRGGLAKAEKNLNRVCTVPQRRGCAGLSPTLDRPPRVDRASILKH